MHSGFGMVHLAAHEALPIQLVHQIVPLHRDAAGGTIYQQPYKNKRKPAQPAWFTAGCQSRELTLHTAFIFFPCVQGAGASFNNSCTCASEASRKKHLVLQGLS